jgi:hypothetical protein
VGPLPEAVGLLVPDAVPTPEGGGCGIELALQSRGHDSSHVQAKGEHQTAAASKHATSAVGNDILDVIQTGRRLPHRHGEGASTTNALQQGEKSTSEFTSKDLILSMQKRGVLVRVSVH